MKSVEAFSRVADRLHEAALSPEEWPQALEALIDLINSDRGLVMTPGADGEAAALLAVARVDEHFARLCLSDSPGVAGPFASVDLPVGMPVTRTAFVSDRDFVRSAIYNEVVRPLNGYYSLHARARRGTGAFVIQLCRPQRAGDFDATATATLQILLPHLATALELQHRLQIAEHGYAGLARALDRLEAGVILTDALARPVFANARASRIVADADGLTAPESGLAAATPVATRRLREAIAAAGQDASIAGRQIRLDRPSHRAPLLLTLLPIFRLDVAMPGARAPRVAIFIKEVDAPPAVDAPALAEMFHLTRRECEVAALLASGRDLAQIASALGIGLGTVRHHLKRVFQKTGLNSQPKLVALLRGFLDPWR